MTVVVGAAVVAALGAAAGWYLWTSGGPQGNPGPYEAELIKCKEFLDGDLGYPEYQEYIPESVWYEGDSEKLRIGGKVWLSGPGGVPYVELYRCLFQNGHVLNIEFN
jgi:hypothetical protein